MDDNRGQILLVIMDKILSQQVAAALEEQGFSVYVVNSVVQGKQHLQSHSVSGMVMSDSEAIPLTRGESGLMAAIPENLPTLVLIKPAHNLPEIVDHVRIKPYAIHEYLVLPVAMEDVVGIVDRITRGTQPVGN